MTAMEAELASVRERLARLEATIESQDRTHAPPPPQEMEAHTQMRDRPDKVDGRTWKLSMVLAVLGLSGGAGAAELLRSLLAGP